MQLAAQAVGKTALQDLGRQDLVTVDKDLAEFMGIRYAGSHRRDDWKNGDDLLSQQAKPATDNMQIQ